MPILLELFLTFARIGLFTFGGGYAMISIIEDLCVDKKKWITHDEMMNMTVIAESTPGPIAINCATYVGYKKGKMAGSILATIGMVLPSFVIIYLISLFLDHFLEIAVIANAFKGIRVAVGFLILDAGINMIRKMKKKRMPVLIVTVSTLALTILNFLCIHFSSIALMLIAAVFSLTVFAVKQRKGGAAK